MPEIGQSMTTITALRLALSMMLIVYTVLSTYIAMKAEPFFVHAMNTTLVWTLIIGVPCLIIGLLLLAVILCGILARRGSGGGLR